MLTQMRLFASYYRWSMLNVELGSDRIAKIDVASPAPDTLALSFDAADLFDDRRGAITIRLRTEKAATLVACLRG